MSNGRSKAKGSSFERDICKRLSLWVSGGEEQDCFWRSAMSGGRSTVAGRRGVKLNRQAGDITSTSPEGHALTDKFYIECKHVKKLDIHGLITGKGALWSFWCEAWGQARSYEKAPFLIAKQNHFTTLACLDRASVTELGLIGITRLIASPDPKFPRTMYVMELDDLLKRPHTLPTKRLKRYRLTK